MRKSKTAKYHHHWTPLLLTIPAMSETFTLILSSRYLLSFSTHNFPPSMVAKMLHMSVSSMCPAYRNFHFTIKIILGDKWQKLIFCNGDHFKLPTQWFIIRIVSTYGARERCLRNAVAVEDAAVCSLWRPCESTVIKCGGVCFSSHVAAGPLVSYLLFNKSHVKRIHSCFALWLTRFHD